MIVCKIKIDNHIVYKRFFVNTLIINLTKLEFHMINSNLIFLTNPQIHLSSPCCVNHFPSNFKFGNNMSGLRKQFSSRSKICFAIKPICLLKKHLSKRNSE